MSRQNSLSVAFAFKTAQIFKKCLPSPSTASTSLRPLGIINFGQKSSNSPLKNSRAVLLTLEALKVPYDFSVINLFEGENKSPEFLRLNPQHSVPVYKEGSFVLTESR